MKKLILIFLLLFTAAVAVNAAPAPDMIHEITESGRTSDVLPGNGTLTLRVNRDSDHPVRFMIYSITGQMVKTTDLAPGEELTVDLPQGYYIVKTAQWSKRVTVK